MTDAELDLALSALTAAEADPRLAERVVRAIEAPPEASRGNAWPAFAALATAALVLFAIEVGWRSTRSGPLPDAPGAPRLAAASIESPHEFPPEDTVVARRASVPTPPPPRDDAPWPYGLPALERSAPLAIERIERVTIHALPLDVEPLSIAQLEIESLER